MCSLCILLEFINLQFFVSGVSTPRRSVTGGELPSPRMVSTALVPDVDNPSPELTLSVMQWGQFIDHDLTHAPIFRFGRYPRAKPQQPILHKLSFKVVFTRI